MFNESLKEGAMGEHVVWNLFNKHPGVRSVVDVREDKGFQEKDIDFLIEDTHRQFTPVEVKTDLKAHETGNIVYELSTSTHMGCFEKTQAKYIMYYVPHDKTVYRIDVKALRTYINEKRPEEKDMGDNATGFLIPIKDLQTHGVIKQTYKGVY